MKLGAETGSIINHLYSRMSNGAPVPEVGMGATTLSWSDRQAVTVISVDGNVIAVQRDIAKRIDTNGMSEMQDYDYTPNPTGSISYFRLDKTGSWNQITKNDKTGRWNKIGAGGYGLILGFRREYYDFSF